MKLISIPSSIPGYYDPSVEGFHESIPKSWVGTRVRIQVECDASSDYGRKLERARRKAEKKYHGAEIFVIPRFKENVGMVRSDIKATDTDERKIREYIRQSGQIRQQSWYSDKVLDYMLRTLSQFEGGLRTTSKVKFKRFVAKNFLSFKKLDIDLSHKGITLIQGINEDRNKKSNGSGKTSYAQVLPVTLFGRTFKDQKSNAWTNRWHQKKHSYARSYLQSSNREIFISRERNPVALRMEVNGKSVESGMRTTAKDGTQQQIENVTGFTWQTLANAVYIDRAVADAFLSGTNKQRTDVLSRFQNLERFTRALEQVKKDQSELEKKSASKKEQLAETRGAIEHTIRGIKDLKKLTYIQLNDLKAAYEKAKIKLQKYRDKKCKQYQGLVLKAGYAKQDYDKLSSSCIKYGEKVFKAEADHSTEISKYAKAKKLAETKKCPTCYQDVDKKWMQDYIYSLKGKITIAKVNWIELTKIYNIKTASKNKVEVLVEKYNEKLSKIKNKEHDLEVDKEQLYRQYKDLQRKQQSHPPVSKAKSRLKKLERRKEKLKGKLEKYSKLREIYKYAAEAFSRDGIPAWLNMQLCPVLNKASSYYAELFSDSEVQVQFIVEGGEFIPKIINTKGGETIEDQSTGERALAGLIASFALREVAPSCNLLCLDEPCEGVDEQTARQFARSLQVLVKRFKSIWLMTHNKDILSELEGERIITIRKKNKISTVEAA